MRRAVFYVMVWCLVLVFEACHALQGIAADSIATPMVGNSSVETDKSGLCLAVVHAPAAVVLLAIGGVIALAASRRHRCQLCGKEIVNDANELPSGWAHMPISRMPDGSAQTALLCDLCSTKGEAAVWVLGRRQQRKDSDRP